MAGRSSNAANNGTPTTPWRAWHVWRVAHLYGFCKGGKAEVVRHRFLLGRGVNFACVHASGSLLRKS
jgi:hypothetical protein